MSITPEHRPLEKNYPLHLSEDDAINLFDRYLKVVLAESEQLLDIAFQLRFQVYCVERGFESAAQFFDGRERDRDDLRALHALLIDRDRGVAIGTVRLILPHPGDELPLSRIIGSGTWRAAGLPLESTAEVSRFAVAKSFRRDFEKACCLTVHPAGIALGARGAAGSLLTFGLIRAVNMMSAFTGVSHIVGLMEPTLLRLLGRFGIVFHPLGEPVQHHGLRQAGWAAMARLNASVRERHPALWEISCETARSDLQVSAQLT